MDDTITELDLRKLLNIILSYKKLILLSFLVSLLLSIIYFITSPKEYESEVIIVPEITSEESPLDLIGNLGPLAGIGGLEDLSGTNSYSSPNLYPDIVKSKKFLRKILLTEFRFLKSESKPLYFIILEYFDQSFTGYIGSLIRKNLSKNIYEIETFENRNDLIYYSPDFQYALEAIEERISVEYVEGKGHITIKTTSQDPELSAILAHKISIMLEDEVVFHQTRKLRTELEFVRKMIEESKKVYETQQAVLGNYLERNQYVVSEKQKFLLEKLKLEYDLSFSIYSDFMTKEKELSVQINRDTPLFNIVQSATVPLKKSEPSLIKIIFVFMILAFLVDAIYILRSHSANGSPEPV